MDSSSRRRFLQGMGSSGTLALAGCLGQVVDQEGQPSEAYEPGEEMGHVASSSGPHCLEDDPGGEGATGWIHTVASGDAYHVTWDLRIEHERSETIESRLSSRPGDEYELAFFDAAVGATGADSNGESVPLSEEDCPVGTRLRGGGSVPSDFERLTLLVYDVEIVVLERAGTVPTLRELPDPIEP